MFSPRRLRPVLALLAAGAVLSVPLPAAHAVVGTPAPDGTHAFTAHLDIGGTRSCSAALVDPEWLVTAASCFADDPQSGTAPAAGKPKLKTVATIGRTTLSGTGGHVAEVTQIVPRAGRDLVFARLASPATAVTPVKLAATAPAAGDALTVLGYGRTKTEWVPGKLHQANYTLDAVADGTLAMTGKSADDSVCKGDTGGPVLRATSGGSYELVAVNSRSWQGGCHGTTETRTGAIAARTDGKPGGASLTAGQTLASGDSLLSKSAKVTMGTDGNLTVASNAGKTLWSSGTSGNAGATATLSAAGNLSVKSAAGASLWESKTSAAGGYASLGDGGDLVVYNAQNQSQWSSNSAPRHDYDGNGRSDMAAWYDFTAGTDNIYTFLAATDGAISSPERGFTFPAGAWEAKNHKLVTGDFNGDGRGDIAALLGYSDTTVKLWTFLGKPDGTFADPVEAWSSPAGGPFHKTYMTPQSGDFNGDGRDDIAVWYAYPDGTTKIWTYVSTASGTFNAPTSSWSAPTGTWARARAKIITGDFNGDGRDDLSVFYGQGDDSIKTYVFNAQPNGGFAAPTVWWQTLALDWNRAYPHSGDFNGDGRDDATIWYDYADGSDKTSTIMSENVDGTDRFGSAKVTLNSPGGLDITRSQLVVGDYNGDGRDDLSIMHYLADSSVKMWTWTARPDALFNSGLAGYTVPATSWDYTRSRFANTYNY
ncbi:FG-GAP-like repeat-containing protein [Streptomyces sp. NBC_00287]|uniref:FG-GAP-like repeat-containing protein n=1 Tax=Streptomyces sp. NBC_00287 TaxID=2975702 RepID=UPI002E2D5DFA|nr:FG-GAP-like repeat-containing protein [Streptomyces sp. NBC_00287]